MSNFCWNATPKTYSKRKKLKPVELPVEDDEMEIELPRNCQDENYNARFLGLIGQTFDFRGSVKLYKEINSPVKCLSPIKLTRDSNEDIDEPSFDGFEVFAERKRVFNSTPLSTSEIDVDEEIKDASIIIGSDLFSNIPDDTNTLDYDENHSESNPSISSKEESSIVRDIYDIPRKKFRMETPHPEVRLPPLVRQNINLGPLNSKRNGAMDGVMTKRTKSNIQNKNADPEKVESDNTPTSPLRCNGTKVTNKRNIFGNKEIEKLKAIIKGVDKNSQDRKAKQEAEKLMARQPFSSPSKNKLVIHNPRCADDDHKMEGSNQCSNNHQQILNQPNKIQVQAKPIIKSSFVNIAVSQSNEAQKVKNQHKPNKLNIPTKPATTPSTAIESRRDVVDHLRPEKIDPFISKNGEVENFVAGTSNQNKTFTQTSEPRLPTNGADYHDGDDDEEEEDACHTPHLSPYKKKVKVLLRKRRRKATVFQRNKLQKTGGASKKKLNFKEFNNCLQNLNLREDVIDYEGDDENKTCGDDNDENKTCDDDNDENKTCGDDNDENKDSGDDNDFHVKATMTLSLPHCCVPTIQLTSTLIDSSLDKDPRECPGMDVSSIRFQADSSILDIHPSTRVVDSRELFDLQSSSGSHLDLKNCRRYLIESSPSRIENSDVLNDPRVAMPMGDRVDEECNSISAISDLFRAITDPISMPAGIGDPISGKGDQVSKVGNPNLEAMDDVQIMLNDSVAIGDNKVVDSGSPAAVATKAPEVVIKDLDRFKHFAQVERCCLDEDFDYDWKPSYVNIYKSRNFDPLAVYPQDDLELM